MSEWIPEIMYEEGVEGMSSHIPFVMVPDGEVMPKLLYIFESRETGEVEPGAEGEEVAVVQWDLHQYADMAVLKEKLGRDLYDEVRLTLGLQKLVDAAEAGTKITEKIRDNFS